MEQSKGFTLIEILIAIAIIGILVVIAYPQYQQHITSTQRTRAIQNLFILSKDMHYYYTQHHHYLNANLANIASPNIINDPYYHYQIQELTAESYQLIAIPQGSQAKKDQTCGKLLLNQLGEKSISGHAKLTDCWKN